MSQWPIDRLRRGRGSKKVETKRQRDEETKWEENRAALALHSVSSSLRLFVSSCCTQALSAGVRVGMTLAEAKALCPGLQSMLHEPEKDARALEALARWLTRFTPIVSIEPPDCILLDLTGCERVFGGIAPIASRIEQAMGHWRIQASLAVAPTVGMAWAMSWGGGKRYEGTEARRHEGKEKAPLTSPQCLRASVPSCLSPIEHSAFSIQHFPTPALRLDPITVSTLHHLGIETIGQLLELERSSLLDRFGPQVLLRIDQALGRAPEMLRPLPFRSPVRAKMEFEGPVDSIEAIWEVFRRLLMQVSEQLTRLGSGARQMVAEFRRDHAPAVRRSVNLSRPTRDIKTLFNLLRCATEALDPGDGFVAVALFVPSHELVSDEQFDIAGGTEQAAAADMARLVEVLSVRLGAEAVVRAEPRACHLPERAFVGTREVGGQKRQRDKETKRQSVKKSRKSKHVEKANMLTHSSFLQSSISSSLSKPFPRLAVDSVYPSLGLCVSSSLRQRPYDWLVPDHPADTDPERTDLPRVPEPDAPGPGDMAPLSARPLRLLQVPRELRVTSAAASVDGEESLPLAFADGRELFRVAHAAGPERIAGLWWEGRDKTRDYYDVETTDGRRFWIFRVAQTGKWYVQGWF